MFIKIQTVLVPCWKLWEIWCGKILPWQKCLVRSFGVEVFPVFLGVFFFASDRNKPCTAFLRHRNNPQLSSCSHKNSWKQEVFTGGFSPLQLLWLEHEPEPVPSNWVTFTGFGTWDSQSLQKPKSTILSPFPLSPSGNLNFNEVVLT